MMEQKKGKLTFSSLSTVVMLVFALSMIFVPDVKAWVISNLMKIGLFSADVPVNVDSEGKKPAILALPEEMFSLDGSEGRISLADQKGKVVFLNFWATWCPPCIAEMPSINTLRKKMKGKDVVFLMIDMDGKFAESSAFMKGKDFDLPVYIPSGNIPRAYFEGSMPTTVILDRMGNMVFKHVGAADYADQKILDFINKL